ncbi:MAG: Calx-beta domain-containing protein, partial [Planctomycetota bacterium]
QDVALTIDIDPFYASPSDYTVTPGTTFTIPAGELSGQIVFEAETDGLEDTSYELVKIDLINPTEGVIDGRVNSAFRIIDADQQPDVGWTTSLVSTKEGETVRIVAQQSGPSQSGTFLRVEYDGTLEHGTDFSGPTRIEIPAGELEAAIDIELYDDDEVEGQNWITVQLVGEEVRSGDAVARILVSSDDVAPEPVTDAGEPAEMGPVLDSPQTLAVSETIPPSVLDPDDLVIVSDDLGDSASVSDSSPVSGGLILGSQGGLINNASVFFDSNFNGIADFLDIDGNGELNDGDIKEKTATTGTHSLAYVELDPALDRDGSGRFETNEGQWVSIGGLDLSTQQAVEIEFTAPASFYSLTPTSTLINALVRNHNLSVPSAVKTYFDAFAVGYLDNIETYSFLTSALEQGDVALHAFAVDTQIMATVHVLAKAVNKVEPLLSVRRAGEEVMAALADTIAAGDANGRLHQTAFLDALVRATEQRLGLTMVESSAITNALSVANNLIINAASVGDIVKVQIVTQAQLSDQFCNLIDSTITTTQFTDYVENTFPVQVSAAQPGNLTAVLLDVSDVTINEGDNGSQTVTLQVTPLSPSNLPIQLDYETLSGTALATEDFVHTTGTLMWNPNDVSARTISFDIVGDSHFEADETFSIYFSNDLNASPVTRAASVTIVNDDARINSPENLIPGENSLPFVVNGEAGEFVSAWIDLNDDGQYQDIEKVLDDVELMAGENVLQILIDANTPLQDDALIRFRINEFDGIGHSELLDLGFVLDSTVNIVNGFVADRSIFYNGSSYDTSDVDAIANDKTALRHGETATFANYTSYSRGINGIMIDVAGLDTANINVNSNDLEFRVGNSDAPDSWAMAPTPSSLVATSGTGVHGTDRIVVTWADNVIQKQWLQVRVKATANTGLSSDEVHYWGNAIGEVGDNPSNAFVNATDIVQTRDNPHNFLNPALIDDVHDFNRDKRVNATDIIIARDNATFFLNALKLITPVSSAPITEDDPPDNFTTFAFDASAFSPRSALNQTRGAEDDESERGSRRNRIVAQAFHELFA